MKTNDILNRPFKAFYSCIRRGEKLPDDETDREIVKLALIRRNIRNALEHNYYRRTYHRDYVTKPLDEHQNTYCRYINSHEQLGGRVTTLQETYCCDDEGMEYVEPWVIQLAARKGREVWVYGYSMSESEGETVYLDAYGTKDEAERRARRRAEEYAQQCYEYYLEDQAQQRLEERRERLHELRTAIRSTLKAIRAMAGDTGLHKALDLLMSERREVMRESKA